MREIAAELGVDVIAVDEARGALESEGWSTRPQARGPLITTAHQPQVEEPEAEPNAPAGPAPADPSPPIDEPGETARETDVHKPSAPQPARQRRAAGAPGNPSFIKPPPREQPKWRQAAAAIKRELEKLEPGASIGSSKELARRLGFSVAVIKDAMNYLASEGKVFGRSRRRGHGWYKADDRTDDGDHREGGAPDDDLERGAGAPAHETVAVKRRRRSDRGL